MLERLFASKTRVKLLRLFLINDLAVYYLKDICQRTGLKINSVKKEIENLKNLNLIKEVKAKAPPKKPAKKNIKEKGEKEPLTVERMEDKIKFEQHYILNKDFILYPELKALLAKSQLLLEEFLVARIKKLGKIYYLALSGFFTNTPSKTDLLVVGRVKRKKIKYLIKKIETDLGREINYTVMSLQEFKYRSDLTDCFLFDILENKKVVLIDNLK
ncbi:MAG: hypothetical protein Athens101410_294 [Parcubacteria group bacterium Athens1014_10]|nr:MAG: hypothetical protein Athens101410_294 [Parcubacteria group bacterium Athens1014_10]TSD05988.1 MAG: hypothetical protein Athens071412_135 [Parcubacteria group bacterium Athens0714_12]